jgi:CRISPR-associated protein Csm3
MQLTNIHILEATLILETGLHIGGGDSEIHIGGIDNEVIKHPVSGEPYIPGSSLKGKIRSLLEWKSGAVQEAPLGKTEYDRAQNEQQQAVKAILQLFGISGDTQNEDFQKEIGHTRVSFWDCPLQPGLCRPTSRQRQPAAHRSQKRKPHQPHRRNSPRPAPNRARARRCPIRLQAHH